MDGQWCKHDEEMRPMHGRHGTLDAEFEVLRTIKRAELTAFLCLLRRAFIPAMVHVDSFIHRPQNIKSPDTTQMQIFHNNL